MSFKIENGLLEIESDLYRDCDDDPWYFLHKRRSKKRIFEIACALAWHLLFVKYGSYLPKGFRIDKHGRDSWVPKAIALAKTFVKPRLWSKKIEDECLNYHFGYPIEIYKNKGDKKIVIQIDQNCVKLTYEKALLLIHILQEESMLGQFQKQYELVYGVFSRKVK